MKMSEKLELFTVFVKYNISISFPDLDFSLYNHGNIQATKGKMNHFYEIRIHRFACYSAN